MKTLSDFLPLILIFLTLPPLFLYDLRERRIPDWLTYPATAFALVWLCVFRPAGWYLNPATAAAVFLILYAIRCGCRGGLGWGDIKYCVFLSLLLGPFRFPPALLVASTAGLAVVLILKVLKKWTTESTLPFGPFLGISCFFVEIFMLTKF